MTTSPEVQSLIHPVLVLQEWSEERLTEHRKAVELAMETLIPSDSVLEERGVERREKLSNNRLRRWCSLSSCQRRLSPGLELICSICKHAFCGRDILVEKHCCVPRSEAQMWFSLNSELARITAARRNTTVQNTHGGSHDGWAC